MREKETFQRIAVAVGITGTAERDYLSGIFRYVNTGRRWSLELLKTQEELAHRIRENGNPDGIVLALPNERRVWDTLRRTTAPTVFIDIPPPDVPLDADRPFSFVRLDDESIGRAAAEHLLSRGRFNSFLCVIDQPRFLYPSHRERGFRAALAKTSAPVATLTIPETEGGAAGVEAVGRRLASLPRPVAVFAVRDQAALKIYDACRRFRFSIPGEVAVLGVDNDELFCRTRAVQMSSILPDHERIGFLAAQELARLMRSGNGREIVLAESVRRVVMRDSTRIIPPAARIVASAMAFIEENAARPLKVEDVARHVGVSRRLAELRFRQVQGETIRDAITRFRVKALKARLAASRESIAHLADEFGFSSPAALVRYFKTAAGEAPGFWRRRNAR